MGIVVAPYGKIVDTSIGKVFYGGRGLRFLERPIVSSEKLSNVSRKLLMGEGMQTEVHLFPSYNGYEGPVAVLFISCLMGRG